MNAVGIEAQLFREGESEVSKGGKSKQTKKVDRNLPHFL